MNIDVWDILDKLDFEVFKFLEELISFCNMNRVDAYLVGGYIRDSIMNNPSKDIDIVFVGNTEKMFHHVIDIYPDALYSEEFKTLKVSINDYDIDLITARREIYTGPGKLPIITPSNILDDLSRRDFTINSLAVKINNIALTPILDISSSINDIKNKQIKIHHNLSFTDDPTRIFRAIRYSVRFDFEIENQTERLIRREVLDNGFRTISKIRILNELVRDFLEHKYSDIIEAYKKYGIYDIIFQSKKYSPYYDMLSKFHNNFMEYKNQNTIAVGPLVKLGSSHELIKENQLAKIIVLIYLCLLDEVNFNEYAVNISKKQRNSILSIVDCIKYFNSSSEFDFYMKIKGFSPIAFLVLSLIYNTQNQSKIYEIFNRGRLTEPLINSADIISSGVERRFIGSLLYEIHLYKFENNILNSDEDMNILNLITKANKAKYFNEESENI